MSSTLRMREVVFRGDNVEPWDLAGVAVLKDESSFISSSSCASDPFLADRSIVIVKIDNINM